MLEQNVVSAGKQRKAFGKRHETIGQCDERHNMTENYSTKPGSLNKTKPGHYN